MGCTSSKAESSKAEAPAKEAGPTPAAAEGTAKKEKKPAKKGKLMQVLVAGYAQSGKSTFFKQMQIIHLNGWTDEQKRALMANMRSNIVLGIKELLEAAEDEGAEIDAAVAEERKLIEETNAFEGDISSAVVAAAKSLWACKDVQRMWGKRDHLPNFSVVNLEYAMEHIDRITAPDAAASEEDILRTRTRTTGTVELEFSFEGKQDFKFVDVGGQKSERRKWSQVIEKPNAVLYFHALPDFDVPITLESKKMRLQESLEVWESVIQAPAFAESILILFLNKKDLFEEKLKGIDYKKLYPDFKGNAKSWEEAGKHQLSIFSSLYPQERQTSLQAHFTCALDTDQIRTVFQAIRASLTERALYAIGF